MRGQSEGVPEVRVRPVGAFEGLGETHEHMARAYGAKESGKTEKAIVHTRLVNTYGTIAGFAN